LALTPILAGIISAIGAIIFAIWANLPIIATYVGIWAIACIAWWAFKGERFGFSGPPYYLVYRTARLNERIRRLSARMPIVWRTIWNLGIVTGVGSMVLGVYVLVSNLVNLYVGSQQAAPVQPIIPIPGVFVTFETFPFLVFAIAICVVTHELSHGIASLAEKVPLKSTGVLLLPAPIAAFVEPDEEKMNQAAAFTKLRIFAAGSYTNLILGLLCIVLLVNFAATIAPFYNVVPAGISVTSVSVNLPAHAAGIQPGDTLTAINGTKVSDIAELRQYMGRVVPGQVVEMQTRRGTFAVKTAVDPSNSSHALIGVSLADSIDYVPKFPLLSSNIPPDLLRTEAWANLVLVNVAIINMVPLAPFDGDKFLDTVLNMLRISQAKRIRTATNGVMLALLGLNFVLSWARFGFVRL
jgi:membrane-associated protease RseP (regulator of RpoE activity)